MATRVVLLFIITRLFFLVIASVSPSLVRIDTGYLGSQVTSWEPSLAWVWANMDGRHFIKIATKGYSGTNFAYFPLYPILINLIYRIGLTPIVSGISISMMTALLAAFYLAKLINLDGLKISKFETILLLFLFPFGFILNAVYADALFLFLTIASFYHYRKSNWLLAGVFAFFATLTRLSGMALFPALMWEWWFVKKNDFSLKWFFAPLAALFGFMTYLFYLQLQFGDWRLFQTSMLAWKQEKFVFIFQVLYRYLKIFTTVSPDSLVYWVAVMEFISFFVYFALSIYVFKKIRQSYGIFMVVLLLLVSFTGTLAGTPRYLIHLFPAYLGLAQLLKKYPRVRFIYYPISLFLGVILTALFVGGRFIG